MLWVSGFWFGDLAVVGSGLSSLRAQGLRNLYGRGGSLHKVWGLGFGIEGLGFGV